MTSDELLEIAIEVDPEAAEAVSELFNRYNGGDWEADSAAGEASGGGAVVEATGLDDEYQPIPGKYRLVVKTYLKPGARGEQIRRQIEEGLWRLSLIYPLPEPQIRTLREEDWAHAWKKFYKPLRIGRRVLLKPSWEEVTIQPDDVVIELDPGMAFGTGLHPSTRLCIAALEEIVQPGDAVLDLGTGSGVLALVAAKLGAGAILATDIDTLAVRVAKENAALNGLAVGEHLRIEEGSVPAGMAGRFQVIVANILAEVLVGLFDGKYENPLLAEPSAPGGYLILSGILNDRAGLVIEAAERYGLRLIERKTEGDWVALVVRRAI
jgi:ribosomal protein L11 methyltransferase